jgi:PAS domain S-box-containing protein
MTASFQGFRSLVENSFDAISMIDPRGEILYGSASTARVLGYDPQELVGRNCLDLIHPEDRDHSRRALAEVLATPGPLQWDARILNKDGNYAWVESTVSNLLSDGEVRAIVVHQRNIDARKVAEAERRQHAEELARSNARLEEFAYIAAHDLREPLRAISVYTEILIQDTQIDASATQMAKFIVDGTMRMSILIDDLLSFASSGVREAPVRVDLRKVFNKALDNLALEILESKALVTVGHMPVVRSNEILLVRLLQNLIGNAIKYRGMESPKVHVSAEVLGANWVIRIKDNGIGIAPENQVRVFMPFVRLPNRGIHGTGLGLSLSKNIVEGLGGTIWVESRQGIGSEFSFTLPATQAVSAPDV